MLKVRQARASEYDILSKVKVKVTVLVKVKVKVMVWLKAMVTALGNMKRCPQIWVKIRLAGASE